MLSHPPIKCPSASKRRVTSLCRALFLCLALTLPSCTDQPQPKIRIDEVPIVRTEGARDMVNESWVKIQERPQPNGDMWTQWGRDHDDHFEVRWEHRRGVGTRFVPRGEEVPR